MSNQPDKLSFHQFQTLPRSFYSVTVSWVSLERHLADEVGYGLDINPDFQRGHVWTQAQQIAYVEYILRGGRSGKDLYLNCPGYGRGDIGAYVLVDGKQRLEAVRAAMAGKIRIFGHEFSEFSDRPDRIEIHFIWNVANLPTRAGVLDWYIQFNSGGTVHAPQEIERVKELLRVERQKATARQELV